MKKKKLIWQIPFLLILIVGTSISLPWFTCVMTEVLLKGDKDWSTFLSSASISCW